MTEGEKGDAGVAVLHRMISYIREEALRLRVMDVALLLAQAEEAMTAFAPGAAAQPDGPGMSFDAGRVEH